MLVYVDDVLTLGPREWLPKLLGLITTRWQCGPVEYIPNNAEDPSLKFFGFELRWCNGDLLLSQADYLGELAKRYADVPVQHTPAPPGGLDVEPSESTSADDLVYCQTALGEILWVACRTRPDTAFVVSRLAQLMTKNPAATRKYVLHLIGYLKGTRAVALRYTKEWATQGQPGSMATPTAQNIVEAQTDSAFAPTCERSQEAVFVFTQGDLTAWITSRQAFTAASTAESELISTLTGFHFGRAQLYVFAEYQGELPRFFLLNDNAASIAVLTNDSNSWRTRHLRIRSHVLREQVRWGEVTVLHVAGEFNISDAGTKSLPHPRLSRLRVGMGLVEGLRKGLEIGGVDAQGRKLQAVILALSLVSAAGQPDSDAAAREDQGFFWVVVVVVASIVAWEAFKYFWRRAILRLRRPSQEPEDEDVSTAPSEAQPDVEDDLVEVDSPVEAPILVPDPMQASSSSDPMPVVPAPVTRIDAGNPVEVEEAFRNGQGFILRYIDDELVIAPTNSDDALLRDARQRELEGLRQAGAVALAQGVGDPEGLRRRGQGLRVYRPEPDSEPHQGPLPVPNADTDDEGEGESESEGEEDVVPENQLVRAEAQPPDYWRPPTHLPNPIVGPFGARRAENGLWVRDALEVQQAALAQQQRRPGLLNQPPNPLISLRDDWPVVLNQPELRVLRTNASVWSSEASALHQLAPHPSYSTDDWTMPRDRPNVLVRWHNRRRRYLFDPSQANTPVVRERLTGRRRTLIWYEANHSQQILDDNFLTDAHPRRMLPRMWMGRTELEIFVVDPRPRRP